MFSAVTKPTYLKRIGLRYMSPYSDLIIKNSNMGNYINSRYIYPKFRKPDVFISDSVKSMTDTTNIKKTLGIINNINSFEKELININYISNNIKNFSDREYRISRMWNLDKTNIFVQIYDTNSISEDGMIELGYWMSARESEKFKHKKKHTVIILLSPINSVLLRSLDNTTFICFSDFDDNIENTYETMGLENVITVKDTDDFKEQFKNIIEKVN